jgi:predicted aspartyl protease
VPQRAILRLVFTRFSKFVAHKKLPALLAALALGLPAFVSAKPPKPAGSVQYEALPLRRSAQDHLLVRAEINGKPAIMVVDTGAPVSAIAINRRAYFGMKPVAGKSRIPTRLSINGAFNAVVIAHNFRLGALNLVDEPMVTINLGGLREDSPGGNEQGMDGIIGTDILSPTKAIIDCDRQMLILKMDPLASGPVPGFNFSAYRRVAMHESDGYNLYVDGSVNGRAAKLMVDTGAFATLLHSRFVHSMKIPLRNTAFRSSGVNLKERGVKIANITRLSIGSMDMRSSNVGVIDLEGLIHGGLLDASPPVAGLLGSEMLQRYHAIIDFGTSSLYLKR